MSDKEQQYCKEQQLIIWYTKLVVYEASRLIIWTDCVCGSPNAHKVVVCLLVNEYSRGMYYFAVLGYPWQET